MDLERLNEFIVLAKHGRLAPAARELHISPSTLSGHISALESELGGPLFERADGFELTPAGEEAVGHVQSIFSEVKAIEDACSGRSSTLVTLRMPNYAFGQKPLYAVRDLFMSRHPGSNIVFKTNELQMSDPVYVLQAGLSDFSCLFTVDGFEPSPQSILPPEVSRIRISRLEFEYYMPALHRLASKSKLEPQDFDGEQIVFTLCPLSSYVAEGMAEFLSAYGATFEPRFKRVHQHNDVFLSELDDALYPRFNGYEGTFLETPDEVACTPIGFEMPIAIDLLYMPSHLTPAQLEYVRCIEEAASDHPLV